MVSAVFDRHIAVSESFLHVLLIFRQPHPNFINVRTAHEIWGTTDKKIIYKIKHRKIPRVHVRGKEETTHGVDRQADEFSSNLVEFVLRSGILITGERRVHRESAMLAWGRMHRKIQRRMWICGHQAECAASHSVEEDDFQIVVEGRADGIIRDGKDVTIDEIKCVYQDVNCLEEAVGVHMAQARCYGYIYGLQEALDEVTLQLNDN